jgi:hypothetical protein
VGSSHRKYRRCRFGRSAATLGAAVGVVVVGAVVCSVHAEPSQNRRWPAGALASGSGYQPAGGIRSLIGSPSVLDQLDQGEQLLNVERIAQDFN